MHSNPPRSDGSRFLMKIDPRPLAVILLLEYLGGLVYLTLIVSFSLGEGTRLNFVPFAMMIENFQAESRHFLVNFVGNILLFVPLGLLAPMLMKRSANVLGVVLIGMILSTLIEFLQWCWGERIADIDDVILNTIGTLLGYGLWFVSRKLWERSVRQKDSFRVSGYS